MASVVNSKLYYAMQTFFNVMQSKHFLVFLFPSAFKDIQQWRHSASRE